MFDSLVLERPAEHLLEVAQVERQLKYRFAVAPLRVTDNRIPPPLPPLRVDAPQRVLGITVVPGSVGYAIVEIPPKPQGVRLLLATKYRLDKTMRRLPILANRLVKLIEEYHVHVVVMEDGQVPCDPQGAYLIGQTYGVCLVTMSAYPCAFYRMRQIRELVGHKDASFDCVREYVQTQLGFRRQMKHPNFVIKAVALTMVFAAHPKIAGQAKRKQILQLQSRPVPGASGIPQLPSSLTLMKGQRPFLR